MDQFRSLLFTPASRPDRFESALASGADAVCLDLEDAVAPPDKASARTTALDYLATRPPSAVKVGLRLNGRASGWFDDDLKAAAGARADFFMIPKAAGAREFAMLQRAIGEARPFWPLVETAEGLMNCWEIAAAPAVAGVLFGAFDFSAEVGCDMSWEPLLFARSQIAAACARAGVQALDAPPAAIGEPEVLAAETDRARRLGFTGRACIHPAQAAPINTAYTPSAAEVAKAQAVIAAFDAAAGGPALLNGKLIELPVARAARRILERARGLDG
ncbi:CoA ester lyase [Phenylobacterium sp.]|uniref:HpcH/HpaI aldolase/citrate lyase family protein n=1 Tax=Phenylobacterium sp. TaxID=1871053 RepID=UPI00272FC991|nr:CoA ester lyase [Phenylobacterium sp.]MDP2215593.1 CoA ester lyase [Phenylobacterium sp.]